MKGVLLIAIVAALTVVVLYVVNRRPSEKYRVLVSTDIGGTDPDDNRAASMADWGQRWLWLRQ
ncbi:MAG: hypothetical protein IJR64_00800 [Bacteroidales bacterium]|nr:hypothetical protein [Bacteroidales bacterium]